MRFVPPLPSRRLLALTSSLLITLPACGAAGGNDGGSNASPFEQLFGTGDSPAEARRKQLAVEESVAKCMKDLGFEYKPVDYDAQFSTSGEEDLSPKEFGEKYGYGLVHSYLLYELPTINGDPVDGGKDGPQFVDPNQDYVNSLTPDEQTQYYAALYGAPVEGEPGVAIGGLIAPPDTAVADTSGTDPATGEPAPTLPPVEDRGCYGVAQVEVYGNSPFDNQDFAQRFNDLTQQLQDDPRLQDAQAEWSDCMYEIDASYDFLTPDEPATFFQKTLAIAKGQKVLPLDPATGMPAGDFDQSQPWSSAQLSDGTGWAFVGEAKKIPDADVTDLQQQELDMWKQDQGCQKRAKLSDVQKQLEQEIVETLQGEFPDFGTAGK